MACRRAVTAIVDDDTAVQALTGRSGRNCVPFRSGQRVDQPVVLLAQLPITPIGGVGDNRRVRFQFTCLGTGTGAQDTADSLARAVERAITQPALAAQGVNGFPAMVPTRTSAGEIEGAGSSEQLARADLDLTLIVTTTT